MANRYIDFCQIVSGTLPLLANLPPAAHALRELEGLVRAVLAAPMDAIPTESAESEKTRNEALEAVKAFGYDNEVLESLSKQLKPRQNHRFQIERISDRLGLAPDSEVVSNWLLLRDINKSVHQRNFDKGLRVDEEFRRKFARPMDVVMRGIAVALQDRYAALIQRAIEIAAMPAALGIKAFVAEVPGAGQLQYRFYDSLTSEDWLPHLRKKGLIGEPFFTPEEDDTGFRQWSVGRYLLRMAASPNPSTRAMVVGAIRALAESTHPDVQLSGVEIAAALPAADAAMLAETISGWLVPGERFFLLHPANIMKSLARAGYGDAALRIATAYFQVFSKDEHLATLHDHSMYEHFLSDTATDLITAAPRPAFELFCELLHRVAVIRKYLPVDEHGDLSNHLFGDIDENPQHRDIPTALAAAIVEAATEAIRVDVSKANDVVARIRSREGMVFERIAMRVVASSSGSLPELATRYLTDADLIGASWCRTEYDLMAKASFPSLGAQEQQAILDRVDSFIEEDRWRKWFVEVHHREPNEWDAREHRFATVHDIVGGWSDVLPVERQRALEAGAAEFGTPSDRYYRFVGFVTSPRSSEDMSSAGVDATITFLRSRAPDSDREAARETTALAGEFRTAVSADPLAYSKRASEVIDLPSIFVRRFLEGLDTPAFNGTKMDWSSLLPFMTTVVRRLGRQSEDADRYPLLRACIALMVSGLRKTAAIDIRHGGEVLSLVTSLHAIASTTPEPDETRRMPQPQSFDDARQILSGGIAELSILGLNWLHANGAASTCEPSTTTLSPAEALRSMLVQFLADQTGKHAAPRMVMGRYLNCLYQIEGCWLRDHLTSLLPADDESLREYAWSTHLRDDAGPIDNLFEEPSYRDCYLREIGKMSSGDASVRETNDHRLTGYLITFHVRGTLPEELLNLFLDNAPISERQDAMRLIGQTIGLGRAESSALKERAERYWSRRLSAAKASPDRSRYANEIGSIGLWFLWNVDVDWLLEQLTDALGAGYAPNDLYIVFQRLSRLEDAKIDRVIEVLEGIATNLSVSRYALMVQPAELRKMLTAGKVSQSKKTRQRVERIINVLASKGVDSFIDLLR
ncbi:hypothetical protein [Bradyrhizobium sp. 1200_D9_N1_1]|uniref:hypothetical protein n=1 Tax=Bradyrhizobium sp. 1200_D9_N1_1 TaxID=3239013 RepID=UPI0004AFF8BA